MTVAFRPAYAVSAQDADDAKPIASLRFAPTERTREKLADLGLLFQERSGGFQLFGQFMGGASGQRRAPLTAEAVLIFGIRTTDPGFVRRFLPDLTAATGPAYYLTNRTAAAAARSQGDLSVGSEVAAVDAARIVGRRFLARADLSANPVPTALALATHFAPKRNLPDVSIPATGGEAQIAVDLSSTPERTFTVAPKPPGTARIKVVVDEDLAARPVIGLLELVLLPVAGPAPAAGFQFTARFRRRP